MYYSLFADLPRQIPEIRFIHADWQQLGETKCWSAATVYKDHKDMVFSAHVNLANKLQWLIFQQPTVKFTPVSTTRERFECKGKITAFLRSTWVGRGTGTHASCSSIRRVSVSHTYSKCCVPDILLVQLTSILMRVTSYLSGAAVEKFNSIYQILLLR